MSSALNGRSTSLLVIRDNAIPESENIRPNNTFMQIKVRFIDYVYNYCDTNLFIAPIVIFSEAERKFTASLYSPVSMCSMNWVYIAFFISWGSIKDKFFTRGTGRNKMKVWDIFQNGESPHKHELMVSTHVARILEGCALIWVLRIDLVALATISAEIKSSKTLEVAFWISNKRQRTKMQISITLVILKL